MARIEKDKVCVAYPGQQARLLLAGESSSESLDALGPVLAIKRLGRLISQLAGSALTLGTAGGMSSR